MATKYTEIKEQIPGEWMTFVSDRLKSQFKIIAFRVTLTRQDKADAIHYMLKMIQGFYDEIEDEETKKAYAQELEQFAYACFQECEKVIGTQTATQFAQSLIQQRKLTIKQRMDNQTASVELSFNNQDARKLATDFFLKSMKQNTAPLKDTAYTQATAGNMFNTDMQQSVKSWMSNYAENTKGKEYSKRVNPRNIAEMTIRYEQYLNKKKQLIDDGVKIVFVPAHANCSKRCQPYQGRLYSLDGTKGTIDGRNYIPIEDVSDNVTYTSQNTGKTYTCGLFSYNCRHTLEPYKQGQNIEQIPDYVIDDMREKETKQREMERKYRYLREKEALYRITAYTSKNTEVLKQSQDLRKQFIVLRKEYVKFSSKANLPYYPERLKVVDGENFLDRIGEDAYS